jgi:hypothetical protein
MDIEWLVHVLDHMGSLHLHKLHCMALDPEIKSIFEPSIADSVLVCLSGFHGEERLIIAVSLGVFAIDENTIRPGKRAAAVQVLPEGGVTAGIPIIENDGIVILRIYIRDRDEQAAVDAKAAKATSCAMHACGWIVDVATNLVLNLEVIGVVGSWGDWAVGPKHSILPGVLPLLDTAPACMRTL